MIFVPLMLLVGLAQEPEPANAKILAFARTQMGKKVGNGECTSLAIEALRDAGIRPRFGRGPVAWGEPRESLKDAQPGDILQFDDVSYVKTTRRPNGAVHTQTFSFPHHTAIVAEVKQVKGSPVLKILHQNAGFNGDSDEKRKLVSEWTLSMKDFRGGTIRAYRPGNAIETPSRPGDPPVD